MAADSASPILGAPKVKKPPTLSAKPGHLHVGRTVLCSLVMHSILCQSVMRLVRMMAPAVYVQSKGMIVVLMCISHTVTSLPTSGLMASGSWRTSMGMAIHS